MLNKGDLPVSQPQGKPSLRKRISSFSVNIHPLSSTSSKSWAKFRRSKSMPSIGAFTAAESIKIWWNLGWQWIMSRKQSFAEDLEMNEEENSMLGWQRKGSWKHMFYKVKSQFRKLTLFNTSLPTTQKFNYDAVSYAQNFDNGNTLGGH